MPAMLLPLALLGSPSLPSPASFETKMTSLASLSLSSSAPRPRLIARLYPWDELQLPSRIAWTVDVGGQPVTFVPLRPSGGFQLNIEMTF